MPRVSIKKKDYMEKDFSRWLIGELRMQGFTQSDLAKWLGISQQAVSQKIKKANFNVKELLILFEELKTDQEQIGKLLKA